MDVSITSSWAPPLLLRDSQLHGSEGSLSLLLYLHTGAKHRPVWNPRNSRSAAALFGRKVSPAHQVLALFCLTLGQKGFLQGFEEGRRRSDKNHIDRTGGFVLSRQKQTLLTRADVAQTIEDSPEGNPEENPEEGPEERTPDISPCEPTCQKRQHPCEQRNCLYSQ